MGASLLSSSTSVMTFWWSFHIWGRGPYLGAYEEGSHIYPWGTTQGLAPEGLHLDVLRVMTGWDPGRSEHYQRQLCSDSLCVMSAWYEDHQSFAEMMMPWWFCAARIGGRIQPSLRTCSRRTIWSAEVNWTNQESPFLLAPPPPQKEVPFIAGAPFILTWSGRIFIPLWICAQNGEEPTVLNTLTIVRVLVIFIPVTQWECLRNVIAWCNLSLCGAIIALTYFGKRI